MNTIWHYHRLGLLDEPERTFTGYREYEVRHLVRLLRIRRLAGLGVPLSHVAARMSEADSSLIHIYAQLLDERVMADLLEMTANGSLELTRAVDALPADADDQTRIALADRITLSMAQNFIDYPWLQDPLSHLKKTANVTAETFMEAVISLYNPAQLDVFYRASTAAHELNRRREEQGDTI